METKAQIPTTRSGSGADPALVGVPAVSAAGGASRVLRLARFAEANAPRILAILIIAFIIIIFAASYFKYETYGQGYDQVDFEQAIWNTTQGRPFADSRFSFTESVFGLDWMPMLALFVPFYAVIPSAHTLFFLQIVAGALGAVAVYMLALDVIKRRLAALVFGALWLIYPTLEHLLLNPFQVRIFAVTALLFALLFFERQKLWPFLACAAFAMTARTDVSLVVIMFGVYALFMRRRWPFVVAPIILGAGYFLIVMNLVLPSYVNMPDVQCQRITDPALLAQAWPGNKNPNLGYYLQWGCMPGEIVVNLVKDPLYTLKYVFGSAQKLGFIVAMLAPFGFLALLAPRGLLLSLPTLGLNLIAWRESQTSYRLQYALLITVGVVAASVYGYKALQDWLAKRQNVPDADKETGKRALTLWNVTPLGALLVFALLVNIALHNPVLGTIMSHESAATVRAANEMIAMVPPDAHVAASSRMGPRLLPREYIYNFPPAPYSPYSMDNFGPLDYIIVDADASALKANPLKDKQTALQALEQSPQWILVRDEQGIKLFKRR